MEQEVLRKQLFSHMFYNLLVVASILTIFGIIVIVMFNSITYSSLDKELIETANVFIESEKMMNNISTYFAKEKYLEIETFKQELRDIRDYNLSRKINDPKYTVIIRDSNLNIINTNDLGRYYEDYEKYIKFDSYNLEKVYSLQIKNDFNYRAINVKLESNLPEDTRYVQLLVNVDSEKILTDAFTDVIISSVAVGIILSIIAGYILAKRTLIPAVETIKKQTEFVQNASHELRTPLTIIQAKQELLLREPNAKIIDKSEEISLTLNETKRLAKLTKDLMVLASAYSNNMILEKEQVYIDELIENTVKPYNEMMIFEEKELKLNLNYEKNVNIDVNKFQQLLIILLDNAIKYTEKGDCIEISTFSKDNKCIIEVKDTGIGISDKGLKEVFNRFYREDRARNRETGGSGLGLSIADTIVKAHNGTIKASHNEPKGTIFTVKLPK